MQVDNFIQDAHIMQTVSDAVMLNDNGFNDFCTLLGLPTSAIISMKKKDDAVYLALRKWAQQIHTIDELYVVLKKFSPALAAKLGLMTDEILRFYNERIHCKEECAVCLDREADHIAPCGHKLC